MNKKGLIALAVIIGVLLGLGYLRSHGNEKEITYSTYKEMVGAGRVSEAYLTGDKVRFTIAGEKVVYQANIPDNLTRQEAQLLESKKIKFDVDESATLTSGSSPFSTATMIIILVALLGMAYFITRQQGGGGGGRGVGMGFSKSPARLTTSTVRLADVAGCDEAKREVTEVVDYLKDPEKYRKLGAKIPTGILMSGSPGVGKTLLAKAIAGEAGVPFFTMSGSDFVEMFVGVGSARIRDTFATARKHAPAILFIDEIDAIGGERGKGAGGGGNDEREQTLNQLLVEMDGFKDEDAPPVIVIAATNIPDKLDGALRRPGRFDREVVIPLPDRIGREQVLRVHARRFPISGDVDLSAVASITSGFSGAELSKLLNEAAIFAAREGAKLVSMQHIEQSRDKMIMGIERPLLVSEKDKRDTAYHEAGHAIIGHVCGTSDPIYKVSIVPRGNALGVTVTVPEEDKHTQSRTEMYDRIAMLFGGRVAEELFCDDIGTGASNDYERATAIARAMVTRLGMTDFGNMVLEKHTAFESHLPYSQQILERADDKVSAILDEQYKRAVSILRDNEEKMHAVVKYLMKWETIDNKQFVDIMEGREPTEPVSYKKAETSAEA